MLDQTPSTEDANQIELNELDETCRIAKEFIKLYYDIIDKKRRDIQCLYIEDAIHVWNGNGTVGKYDISKFLSELPSSEHKIITLDAQPLENDLEKPGDPGSELSILIHVSGTVKYSVTDQKQFQHIFNLLAQGKGWKITSDVYRFQDAIQYSKY